MGQERDYKTGLVGTCHPSTWETEADDYEFEDFTLQPNLLSHSLPVTLSARSPTGSFLSCLGPSLSSLLQFPLSSAFLSSSLPSAFSQGSEVC